MRGSPVSRRAVQRFRQIAFSSVGSVKIKLLLGFCIVFALILFASRASTFARWKNPHTSVLHPDNDNIDIHRGDEIEIAVQKSKTTQSPPLIVKGYTLLINTWKRNDLLRKSISHYAECPRLDSIHIIWSEPDPPSESLANYLEHIVHENTKDGHETEVKFDINKEDSLNNRFKENEDLKTDVVFSIDDDVILPCSSVELAFSIWLSAPDTMVGFVPRMHWVDKSENINDHYVYGGWWSVWWMGTYSMVLSKAAFFHKKYLAMYTNGLSASIKEYIAQNRNCEDIAMSFLVANASGAPPIWVKGKIFEIGSTGISSLGGHSQKRTECVNRFAAEFGRMPLVSTTIKVVDSRNTWFW